MGDEYTPEWFMDVLAKCPWLGSRSDPPQRVVELIVEDAIPKGFNYSARLLRLKATVLHKSGSTERLSVIMKQMPLDKHQKAFITANGLFVSETLFYDEVLFKIEQLLSKHNSKEELYWPKHLTVCKQSSLLLQDLKELDYTTIHQREMSLNEGLVVMRALGRLHAMSRILINEGAIDIKNYQVMHMTQNQTIIEFVYVASIKAIADAVRVTEQTQWYDRVNFIESHMNSLGPALDQLVKTSYGLYDVLNHGDCWLNNIMFKYDTDDKSPTSLKLIDFQLSNYNCFAWDLVHFIYCSYLSDTREQYKKHLVSAYRAASIETYIKFGSEELSARVPTEEVIISSMDKIQLFGFLVSLATVPRLLPNISSSLDLDIMSPDHAHRSKTVLYSIPEVFDKTTTDLQNLYNVFLKI